MSKRTKQVSMYIDNDYMYITRREMKRESLNTSIPRFHSRSGMLNHIGGTYLHSSVMDYPTVPFTEWNLGKFSDAMEFQSWKSQLLTSELNLFMNS